MQQQLGPPPMNPITRVIAALLAVAALVGAFFFGLIILVLAVGLGILGWLFLTLRLWWLRRQFGAQAGRRPGGGSGPGQSPGSGGRQDDSIEAEYKVVSRRQDG